MIKSIGKFSYLNLVFFCGAQYSHRWTVMRMDCGEAEADSVRPRAFFSLAMNLRKSNTRSVNGMT